MKTFISKIVKSYGQDEVRIHSSSTAFYIVVSALPLIFIIVYVLSFLSPVLQEELELFLGRILPKDFSNGLRAILIRIKERRLTALVPFSVLAALWGSTKGVSGICYGIESVYKTKKRSHIIFRWLKAAQRTLAFYGVIIGSLLIFALGRLITPSSLFVSLLLSLRIILFILSLCVFFSYFYSRLANSPIKNHLPGGIFASLGWVLFTALYSIYVKLALNSTSIYAELGTAIFFMLWVYFCVIIIFLGAIINKVILR